MHFLCVVRCLSCLLSFIISENDVVYWININNVLNALLIHKKIHWMRFSSRRGRETKQKYCKTIISKAIFLSSSLIFIPFVHHITADLNHIHCCKGETSCFPFHELRMWNDFSKNFIATSKINIFGNFKFKKKFKRYKIDYFYL